VLQRPIESAQYTSFAFTAQLLDAGIDASVGTVGDALDNALMESQIGLKPPEPTDAHPPLPPLLTGPPAMQARAARPPDKPDCLRTRTVEEDGRRPQD
jgi:transposase InsO family protein